eukprot:c7139_g1_i1.p1 GENE.c7139_g1_i1~~c7139_g1_i1.p1  ORF type:complete len:244 (+),score=65.67 c7139_g1_i1:37-768(+)
MLKVCLVLLAVTQAFATEEETFTIMLDSKDYVAHHPIHGFKNHHEMDEEIPLLLQIDEATVMKNAVPAHCAPEVKFASSEEIDASATEFIQLKAALTPSIPLNPTTSRPMDMNTLLPLAAGAYFLMNGGMNTLTDTMKSSGLGMKEIAPVLLSLATSAGGNSNTGGAGGLGSMAQLLPMLMPMLSGGGGGGGNGGMAQMMQMAPQLMQMMGGAGGGMGGGMGGMGGNGAMAAQLLPMLMGGGM